MGTTAAARLRREGFIPGVIYGRGKKPHAIAVPARELRAALSGPNGRHAILDVTLAGQKTSHASILKDFQVDPIRGRLTHFDLHEVRLDQPITAQVAVELVGESPGVKAGGVLSALVREVSVEALPLEIPDRLELDISGRRRDAVDGRPHDVRLEAKIGTLGESPGGTRLGSREAHATQDLTDPARRSSRRPPRAPGAASVKPRRDLGTGRAALP